MKKGQLYWIKLMKDFYNRLEIRKLMKQSGGSEKIICFQQMQLLSLDNVGNEGFIPFKGLYGSIEDEIAAVLDKPIDDIAMTISYFERCNWLEIVKDGNNVLGLLIKELEFGSASESQARVMKHRLLEFLSEYLKQGLIDKKFIFILKNSINNGKINSKKKLDNIIKTLHCNVENSEKIVALQCNVEKEIETEKEIDITTSSSSSSLQCNGIEKINLSHEFQKRRLEINNTTLKVFNKFPKELVLKQLKNYDVQKKENRKNPMGWLYIACKDNYSYVAQSLDKSKSNIDIEQLKQKQLEALQFGYSERNENK